MQSTEFVFDQSLSFLEKAQTIFNFQRANNKLYSDYCRLLNIPAQLKAEKISDFPFLPISFFKNKTILSVDVNTAKLPYFSSSGTTAAISSKHFMYDNRVYLKAAISAFEKFYGNAKNYCFLGLLPGYLERENASLVYMVKQLMAQGNHKNSGFFLNDFDALKIKLKANEENAVKTILIGVTYALLDFGELIDFPLKNTTLIETGGMKGNRKEMVKEELHILLKKLYGLDKIHSEYGMTELFSQAYSKGEGIFSCSDTMRICIRDLTDPFYYLPIGKRGGINIIDLANIYSCSFIQTDDVGRLLSDKHNFEILGRIDHADIRGCNLMLAGD